MLVKNIFLRVLIVSCCCLRLPLAAGSCYTLHAVTGLEKGYLQSILDYFTGSAGAFEPVKEQVLPHYSNHTAINGNMYSGVAYNLKNNSYRTFDLRNVCITQFRHLAFGWHGKIFPGRLLNEEPATDALVFKTVRLVTSCQAIPVASSCMPMDYRVLEREVRIQKKIGIHPNILVFHEAYYFQPSSQHNEMTVMAFSMDRLVKTLATRTKEVYGWINRDQITATQMAKYMAQILSAIEHLLSKGLLIMDLHAANIMLDEADTIKLIDFSYANEYDLNSSDEEEFLHKDFKRAIPWILCDSYSSLIKTATLTEDDKAFFSDTYNTLLSLSDDSVSIQQRDYVLRTAIESLKAYNKRL